MNYLTAAAVLAVVLAHPVLASLEGRSWALERTSPKGSPSSQSGTLRLAQGVDKILDQSGLDKSGIQQHFDRSGMDKSHDVESGMDKSHDVESGMDKSHDDETGLDQAGQTAPASPILLPQDSAGAAPAVSAAPAEARAIENNEEGRATGLPPGDVNNPYYTSETN
jgi:hypothetical protein